MHTSIHTLTHSLTQLTQLTQLTSLTTLTSLTLTHSSLTSLTLTHSSLTHSLTHLLANDVPRSLNHSKLFKPRMAARPTTPTEAIAAMRAKHKKVLAARVEDDKQQRENLNVQRQQDAKKYKEAMALVETKEAGVEAKVATAQVERVQAKGETERVGLTSRLG